MAANLFLLIASGVLIAAGVYLLLDRAMTRMIMGILLLGNGVNLLLLQSGGQAGSPPIIGRTSERYPEDMSDPLAQAMILTAIVISMAMVAFLLGLAYRQFRYRVDDLIERDEEDRAVAARPSTPSAQPGHDASDDPNTGRTSASGDEFGPHSFEKPVKGADSND